jgi:hypothetical protein
MAGAPIVPLDAPNPPAEPSNQPNWREVLTFVQGENERNRTHLQQIVTVFLGIVTVLLSLAVFLFYKSLSEARADVRGEMIKQVEQEFAAPKIQATLEKVAQEQIGSAVNRAITVASDQATKDIQKAAARIEDQYRPRQFSQSQLASMRGVIRERLADLNNPSRSEIVAFYDTGNRDSRGYAESFSEGAGGLLAIVPTDPTEPLLPRGISLCTGAKGPGVDISLSVVRQMLTSARVGFQVTDNEAKACGRFKGVAVLFGQK